MIKLAFFDMDGTLCVPTYKIDGNETVGFDEEGWLAYCIKHGANSYDHCKPLPKVRDYAAKLKSEGAKLYVLTGVLTSIEVDAKRKFVAEKYPDLFEDVISVGDAQKKLLVIKLMAEENGVDLSECELVEDTYTLVLDATIMGIKGTHVAQFLIEE